MNTWTKGITDTVLGSSNEAKIYKTYDYEIFKRISGNRNINKSHVQNLTKSMEKRYFVQPLTVNEDMEIIDGQHRYFAAQSLSLPIYYQIEKNANIEDVQVLNTNTKNWSNKNYLDMFYERGFHDYKIFKSFMDEYKFSLDLTLCLLLNISSLRSNYRNDFKNGKFKISDLTIAKNNAEKIIKVKPYYRGFNRVAFARALMILFKTKEYKHDIFLKKLKYCSHMLQDKINASAYLVTIEEIYNFNSKTDYIYLTRRK